MEKISKEIEDIYNQHLAISRKSRNKPFQIRKDFSKFEFSNDFHKWKILEHFFKKFPNVDKVLYFKAPYELWKDKEYFPVDFYIKPGAIKAYTTYKTQLQQQNPDLDESLEYIKKSLLFIGRYCEENKISINDYISNKIGSTYTWMKHIRNGSISPYVIFGFNYIDDIMSNTPMDERSLLLGEFANKFYHFKEKYNKSKLAKQLVTIGLNRIKNKLNSVDKK